MKHHVSYCATANDDPNSWTEPARLLWNLLDHNVIEFLSKWYCRYSSPPDLQQLFTVSTCHSLFSRTKDNQKHELVGRILQEQDTEQWGAVFESAALQRFRERSIRFVEMSGRENELKLDPFERLFWM